MNELERYFNDEVDFTREKYDDDVEFIRYPIHGEVLKSIEDKFVLSLGCGTGRETKLLVSNNNKVVAVDLSPKAIENSKKIEPNAEYYCINIIDYLDNRKYDCIVSIDCVFNYITRKEDRNKLVKNIKQMLEYNGEIIIQLTTRTNFLKIVLGWFKHFIKGDKDYSWGDIYYKKIDNNYNKNYPVKVHLYSKQEIKDLFGNMNYKFIEDGHKGLCLIRMNKLEILL